jgi:eukaryotic-like serine/threonine-protein kinase
LSCPSCKEDIFLNLITKGDTIKCHCGHSYSYPLRLVLGKYNVPLFPGVELYACHTRGGNDDYSAVTGEVIMNKNNPSLWGIKNLSDDSWYMTPENGEGKNIDKGSVIPITSNLNIQFKEINGKIIKE